MDYIATITSYWWLLLVLGVAIVWFGRKIGIPKKWGKPIGIIVAVVGLLGAGLSYGLFTVPETTTTTTLSSAYPDFDVRMAGNTTGFDLNTTTNSAKTKVTFPFIVTSIDRTQDAISGTSTNVLCRATFTVTPIPVAGSTSLGLCTLYYDVTNGNAVPGTGSQYLVRHDQTTGLALINFTSQIDGLAATAAVTDGSGHVTGDYQDTFEVWIDFICSNHTIAAHMPSLAGGTDMVVTFHNQDNSWSESFTLNFIKISDAKANVCSTHTS
jgi:hypothetical protein